MSHDPFCYFNRDNGEFDFMADICVRCQLIARVRADERSRKGTCWREAEGSQIPSGAVRVYREAGWFWEMPTVNTIKAVDGVTEDEITEFLEQL